MKKSQAWMLEEYIERAYAQRGYVALSQQETDQLVDECVQQVENVAGIATLLSSNDNRLSGRSEKREGKA
jgi:hypothetical protein